MIQWEVVLVKKIFLFLKILFIADMCSLKPPRRKITWKRCKKAW